MRRTAIDRSTGVRNQALVGESGKRNLYGIIGPMLSFTRYTLHLKAHQNAVAMSKVRNPVIIINLQCR